MNPSMVSEQGPSSGEELFSAFREERSYKRRWMYFSVVPLCALGAAWLSMVGQPHGMPIVTARGIKQVHIGMSQQDVLGRVGNPIGKETRADGMECFQHGMFSINEPTTTVYVLCYVGGQLKEMSTRRYSLWTVDPSGAFVPAGVPTGKEEAPAQAAPPAMP